MCRGLTPGWAATLFIRRFAPPYARASWDIGRHRGASGLTVTSNPPSVCPKLRGRSTFRCIVVRDRMLRAYLAAFAIGCLCPAYIGLG